MSTRIYIRAVRSDWSGPVEEILEEFFYGPFSAEEEQERVNDAFADMLEADRLEVESILMTDEEAKTCTINSREFWMTQLALYQEPASA